MPTLYTLLLMVVVVVGLRVLARRRVRAREAALANVAAMLGFGVSQFDGLGAPMPAAGTGTRRGLARAATLAWGVGRALHGQWNGRAVSIGAPPTRRYRIAVAAAHQWPPALGLWAQPVSSNLGAPPEALDRVRSGDEAFDREVHVCAADRAGVEALLRREAVRAALRDLVGADPTALVEAGWVQVRPYDSALADPDAVRHMLDIVTRAAEALDRARVPGEPPAMRD